eukprot:3552718-Rhodomonas_salina.1
MTAILSIASKTAGSSGLSSALASSSESSLAGAFFVRPGVAPAAKVHAKHTKRNVLSLVPGSELYPT